MVYPKGTKFERIYNIYTESINLSQKYNTLRETNFRAHSFFSGPYSGKLTSITLILGS